MKVPSRNSEWRLPCALDSVEPYYLLPQEIKHKVLTRLLRIDEVCRNILADISTTTVDVDNLVDNCELDFLQLQSSQPDLPAISQYIQHSEWTRSFSKLELVRKLDGDIQRGLNVPIPDVTTDKPSIVEFFEDQARLLVQAIESFFVSETAEGAIAHILAIDLIVYQMALAAAKTRINAKI